MGRALSQLTAVEVKNKALQGRYGDGGGLYLEVEKDGAKRWLFRYQLRGRRRDMSLGAVTAKNGLGPARQAAQDARGLLAKGVDPIDARRRPAGVPTFKEHATALIEDLAGGWRGRKTRDGWERSLLKHAAKLGPKLVDQITTEDVLRVLKPLWTDKPESGAKMRERIERVLDSARAAGAIASPWENPARWRGHLAHMLPKRRKLTNGHHAAMPYAELPAFMVRVAGDQGLGARALEWTILTAAREGMVREAPAGEVRGDLWTVPGARMKLAKEHRVPLAPAALAVLKRVHFKRRRPGDLIFPGLHGPMNDRTMDDVLHRMSLPYTVHGFRSTFRDWAGDCTAHPREVVEEALAHQVGDEVERAYRRSDALEKRRRLMEDWATFATTPPATPAPGAA